MLIISVPRLLRLPPLSTIHPALSGPGQLTPCARTGLSANDVASHEKWIKDINELSKTTVKFPIIGDKERKVRREPDRPSYMLLPV